MKKKKILEIFFWEKNFFFLGLGFDLAQFYLFKRVLSARVSPLVLCAGSWLSYLGCVRNGGVKWVPTRLCVENLVRFSFEWLLSSGKPSHAFACL